MPHKIKINAKLAPLLMKSKPIKVAIGGRGSGKSIGFGDIFTMKMVSENADVYCLREFQDSLNDSVHRVFVDSIEKRLKLPGWDIQENKVVSPRGSKTNYKGASRNPDSIQSAQGYKYSWFEEAHRASKSSLDKLLPTIIRNPGAECWFSANPQSRADPFSQRFIVPYEKQLLANGIYEDDIHLIVVINWRDNPWWSAEQEALRQWDYDNRERAEYDWIWEGKFNDTVANSIISAEWFDAAIDAHIKLGFKPTGAKIASHDPSDTGPDPKGYALRHGSVFLDIRDNPQLDVNEGLDWAVDLSKKAGADWFVWDCDGMGTALKREVDQHFSGTKTDYFMFKGSESPDNPDAVYMDVDNDSHENRKTNKDTFANKRAQYYARLRDRFYKTYQAVTKGQYIDPDELISLSSDIQCLDEVRAEVCRLPRKLNNNGKFQLVSKVDMIKKPYELPSPNMADSMMMAMFSPKLKVAATKLKFAGWN